jgi:hypothetical protein
MKIRRRCEFVSDRIITDNLNKEFKMAKNGNKSNHGGGAMLRSSLLNDRTGIPPKVQRKMANASLGNIKMGGPTFYHPLFQNLNIMLPRDRRERNEWCRHFYRTEPIVATSLDLHTEFPISDFNNICADMSIKKFFDHMAFERIDIVSLLLDIGLEYWKIGDVFPFGQLNEEDGMWQRFVLLNPDYIDMRASIFAGDSVIELIPDEQVRAIVTAGPRGEYAEIYNQLPEDVVRQVRMGKNIRLDNRLISHIAHKASPYEVWGTPIMMRCFKTLIYKDKLREAQNAIANRHITPLRIFKVGAQGEPMPTQEDLDSLRDTLMRADEDPNFMLVYHYGLQTDYVGSAGKILPLNTEFDFIQNEILNGLGMNKAMLNGEGPTYANAQVGFDTLARRYMSYRLRLESWIRKKVYKPIAEIQGFYKPESGTIARRFTSEKEQRKLANKKEMSLIVPEIAWQQTDLTSNQSVLNFIQQLQSKGLVSMHTVLPILNLDPETERKNLEMERGSVFDPNAPKVPMPPGGGPGGGAPPMPPPPGGPPKAPGDSSSTPPKPPPPPPPEMMDEGAKRDDMMVRKSGAEEVVGKDFLEKNGNQEMSSTDSRLSKPTTKVRRQVNQV